MAEEGEPKPEESSLERPPKVADEKKPENEDIPPDFFDDFLKDDFMAGLDIVDEDIEENNEKTEKESKSSEKLKEKSEEQKKKVKKLSKRDQELKQLDKELDEIRNKTAKKPDNKSKLDADNFDIRRDPEKTRQAIQQDKIKSTKRLINDIVETGLVPPGMELEVDMEQVKYQPKIRDLREKLRPRNSSVENPKKARKRSKTPSKKRSKTPSKKRSKTPSKKRSKTPSKKRSKSPLTLRPRKETRKSRSRPRLTRSRTRSPLRIHSPLMPRRPRLLSPSPPRRRMRRTRSPSLIRRRTRSPSLTRRRSRSPIFNRSWRRRRSPSYSPRRKLRRSRSRSPKPSFLEEIAAKLNCKLNYMPQQQFQGNNQVYGNMVPMAPMPVPAMPPQPVPHQEVHFFVPPLPQEQPPAEPYDPFDQYDESFFIGGPSPTVNRQEPAAPQRADAGKLFNDKRIQLSDFLAITAKPVLSNTASTKLSEKVKVIRRVQDAIKEISQPFCHGPLFVRRTDAPQTTTNDVTVSPFHLKTKVPMPFFASNSENMLADMEFPSCCETLLGRVGLAKRFDRAEAIRAKSVSPVPIKARPKPYATTGCQTDKELSSCKECLRRKGILYANAGVQASSGPNMSFSVSTQVCDADFYATIPRNQPLSSLTAAQLLGKQAINPMPARNSRPIPEPPLPPSFYSGFNPPWNSNRDTFRY